MKSNGPGRQNLGRNLLQLVKHGWLYSDLLKVLKGQRLLALGSQFLSWFLISAYTVPPCREGRDVNDITVWSTENQEMSQTTVTNLTLASLLIWLCLCVCLHSGVERQLAHG